MPYFNTDYLSGALTANFRNHFYLLLLFSVVEHSSKFFNMRLCTWESRFVMCLYLYCLQYLAFSCGMIRGALSSLGINCIVTAEVSAMPACKLKIRHP